MNESWQTGAPAATMPPPGADPHAAAPGWPAPPSHGLPRPGVPPLGPVPRRVGLTLVAVGVLVDLAVRSRAAGVAAVAAVAVAAVGLAWAGRVRRPVGRVLLVAAVGVSLFLAIRADPVLVAIDVVVVAVLVSLACSSELGARRRGTSFGVTALRLARSTATTCVAVPPAWHSVTAIGPSGGTRLRERVLPLLRGLLVAAPFVVVVGAILALADPVFAAWLDLEVDRDVLWDVVIVAASAWVLAGWFLQATRPPEEGPRRATPVLGAVEGAVVMVGLTVVYAVFAASQWVVAQRGAAYVARTTGVTYAEYARSGFFLLLAAAGVTVVALLWLRSSVARTPGAAARVFAISGVLASLLTLVVVHAALSRLGLYEDAFGQTRLRWYSTAFAWWLGAAFLVVAASFVRLTRLRRDWLPTALGLAVLVGVVLVNVADPDRAVATHNVERALGIEGATFDPLYAGRLAADATPVLADAVPRLGEHDAELLTRSLCDGYDPDAPVAWNLAGREAAAALDELCR